jgi:hypothetical protein
MTAVKAQLDSISKIMTLFLGIVEIFDDILADAHHYHTTFPAGTTCTALISEIRFPQDFKCRLTLAHTVL